MGIMRPFGKVMVTTVNTGYGVLLRANALANELFALSLNDFGA